MTTKEAAEAIGCSTQQVTHLIRAGKLRAERYIMPGGYWYDIPQSEVRRYQQKKQISGWPRGQSR